MKLSFTLRLASTIIAAGAVSLVSAGAIAQGPGGGMPPEIAAKIKLWQKYGEEHKKASGLGQTVRKIENMNKEDEFKLDKKQASKMLSVMNKWSNKPSLTEDEAGIVTKEVNSFLTLKQIKKMTTMPNGFGRAGGGGGGGFGGGRPGGGGGAGRPGAPGARPNFPDPPKVGINPFNANSMTGVFKDMMKKSLDDFKGQLETQAR